MADIKEKAACLNFDYHTFLTVSNLVLILILKYRISFIVPNSCFNKCSRNQASNQHCYQCIDYVLVSGVSVKRDDGACPHLYHLRLFPLLCL